MEFSLTAEQRELVDTARAFGAAEIAPHYRDREAKMDRATLRKMGSLGLFGIELPESRDLLGLQIGDGTAQIMKMVIARQKAC